MAKTWNSTTNSWEVSAAALTWVAFGTLVNGWTKYNNNPYGPPEYAVSGGMIYFRGGVNGSAATASVIWTLPTGARPVAERTAAIFNQTYFAIKTSGNLESSTGAPFIVFDGTTVSL